MQHIDAFKGIVLVFKGLVNKGRAGIWLKMRSSTKRTITYGHRSRIFTKTQILTKRAGC